MGAKQAASVLGVKPQRVYQAVDTGELPCVLRRPLVLKLEDVEAFRDREKSKGGRPKKAKEAGKQP